MSRARTVLALIVAGVLSPALAIPLVASGQDSLQHKPGVTISFRGLGTGAPTVFGRPRHFVPITAVLQNDGATDVEGLLRVYRSQEVAAGVAFSAVPEQGLFYERPVTIPRGGKRIEELYYYCQDREPDRICVVLETTTGETIVAAPHPKLDLRTGDLLALSVTSSDQDDAVSLAGATIAGPRRSYELQVKHGDPASLPEKPEGFGAFDLVILSDLDPRSMSKQQMRALTEWVELGGDLLVAFSGKAPEGLGALDDSLLPALPAPGEAVRMQDLHALEPLVPDAPPMERVKTAVRRVTARPGARILAGTADEPLIVRGRLGAGRITYFAFPLATLKSCWGTDKGSGGKTVLAFATHAPLEDLDSMQPPPIAPPLEEVLLNLTEALKTLDPPSSLLVAPLLILYVTLVAPLNYLVLSRLGKRDLAMATAAVIAVVFGAVFYLIGWYVHGTGSLVARAAIVELPADPEARARLDTMTGFFSTDRGVLDARIPKGAAVAPVAERPSGRGGRVVMPAGGTDASLKALELDTWSLRRFRTTRLDAVGAVVADLKVVNSTVVGTIENRTRWLLETPVLLVGERVIELKDLQPGEKRALNEPPYDLRDGLALDQRLRRGLDPNAFKARYGDPGGFGAGGGDPYEGSPARRFRAALQRRAQAMNAGPEGVPALLAACVEKDLGGVDLDAAAKVEVARALVLSEITIDVPGPDFTLRDLPASVVRGKGYEAFSGSTGSAAHLGFVATTNQDGFVTFEWRLPASRELPIEVKKLELAWHFQYEPDGDKTTLKLFNWPDGKWLPWERMKGVRNSYASDRNDLTHTPKTPEQLRRYVDPESGVVQVQIETSMADLYLYDLTLSVSASRKPRQR